MMHIPNDIYIQCDKCGNVTLVEADGLDYETSVYERYHKKVSTISWL